MDSHRKTLKGKLNSQPVMNTSWLLTMNKAILKMPIQKFENLILSFRTTHEASVRNSKILAAFKGYLGAAIAAQKDSTVKYGSEFRDIASLERIFLHHEEKTKIINIIQQVSCYHLNTIEEETRRQDVDEMILRGKLNHTTQ